MNCPNDRLDLHQAHPGVGALGACRDERGASILIALFYFLVCAVVGAVVLTAATVTTGQLVALEESQQAYYSVSSAAELLRDSIEGGTCKAPSSGGTDWTCSLLDQPNQPNTSAGVDALNDWLAGMVGKASQLTATNDVVSAAFDMTFSSSNEKVKESVLDVSVEVTMRADYSLFFTLRPKNYSEPVGDYRMTLEIPAALLHDESGRNVERITWERAIIGKGGAA